MSMLELEQSLLLPGGLRFDLGPLLFNLSPHDLPGSVSQTGRDRYFPVVVADDLSFDGRDGDVGLVAAAPPPQAEEVLVDPAMAPVTREHQASATALTEQAALEVVPVGTLAFAGHPA